MRLLILGGTLFLGRHVVDAALSRGHDVTLFNRGTRPAPWSDVESLVGDRANGSAGLAALAGRRWDAVVDCSGYVPRIVGASARLLADAVPHYTFVSSASVYRDLARAGLDESAEVLPLADPASEDVAAHYGALKAASERAVDVAMPGRALHVRAGLIVGPHDPTGRFAYWVGRFARGGEVLAPGDPRRPVQLVDARDLAAWIVTMAETRRVGTCNATGPADGLTMGGLLEACRAATPSRTGPPTWVDDAFLARHGVAAFTDLPLWLPPALAGLLALDVSRAVAAGLAFRPLATTIADTARWFASQPADATVATLASGVPTKAGLAPERERALLAAWHARESAHGAAC